MKRSIGQGIILLAILVSILTGCAAKGRSETELKQLKEQHATAVEAFVSEDYAQASALFLQIAQNCANDKDEWYVDAQVYYARCLQELEQYEQACDAYNEAVPYATGDTLAMAYFYLGCSYIARGTAFENDAVKAFDHSLEIKPDDYAMNCRMCEAFMGIGLTDRAESYLKRIISDENSSDFLVGKTYYYLGRYEDAVPFLIRAVDADENDANYYLGVVYEALGDATKAEDFYRGYINKHPEDAVMLNQYAAYMMTRENYSEALKLIEETLQLEDHQKAEQVLLYNQAICYEYLGDYAKAKELFKSYTDTYPLDTVALKEYKFLQSR